SFGDVLSDQFLDFAGGFPLGPENADSLSAMNTPKRPCLPLLKSMARLTTYDDPVSRCLAEARFPLQIEHDCTGDYFGPKTPPALHSLPGLHSFSGGGGEGGQSAIGNRQLICSAAPP